MLNWLRNRLRTWLAPDPAAEPEPVGRLNPSMLASFQGMPVVRRDLKAPALPPGVVPKAHDSVPGLPGYMALDSAINAPIYSWFNGQNCGLGFPGYAYLSELSQRSEYRAPTEVIAQELVREWVVIKTEGKSDPGDTEAETDEQGGGTVNDALPGEEPDEQKDGKPGKTSGAEDRIADILNAFEEFDIQGVVKRACELDNFFGRSQIYIDIDHGERPRDEANKLPLLITPETVKKGSLRGFRVIEPIWTTPYYYNANDPTAEDFYKPKAWYVLGKLIHADRLLTCISRPMPDLLKPAYNFGGISLTQLMEPYVFQWLRTRNSVSDLVHNFSIITLATNMQAVIAGDAGAPDSLLTRAKLFTANRDNQGLMLVDKDSEELQQIAVPLSGLDALQAQAQEHMAAPTHIPLVKLLGITPQGLNASSEGEIKVFYDFIRSQQQIYAPIITAMLQLVQLHLFGEIDDAITFEFVPLTSPSVKELSDIRKADADSGRAYIEAGVVSPDEERERLMADPNSGYTNLAGPAPEPPPTPGLDPMTGEPLAGGPFAPAEESGENGDSPKPPKKD